MEDLEPYLECCHAVIRVDAFLFLGGQREDVAIVVGGPFDAVKSMIGFNWSLY